MTTPILTPTESRVVAVLLEKQRTVPDTYPMSLSALVGGCNQKTARDPVMNLTDQDVLQALASLRQHDWVIETTGSRVMRYEQNARRVLNIPSNGLILLAVLMLRGPQTVAELRANSQRWYEFADASSVQAYLDELAERSDGALVVRLARQPGARESRWTHLLCGPVQALADVSADAAPAQRVAGGGEANEPPVIAQPSQRIDVRFNALESRVHTLEAQLAELRALVAGADAGGDADASGASHSSHSIDSSDA